jgi:rhodanese-related sulfurtransferase
VSNKSRRTSAYSRKPVPQRTGPDRRLLLAAAGGLVAALAVVALVAAVALGAFRTATPTTWTNVSADQLASMLQHKDFTFVNVKTPYIGEIDGTDLYIPYDQIAARAAELPQNKDAKILVYCRSGAESAQAAQTLLNMGYTNIWNLDGGMNAWTASGRTLVQKNRT